MNTLSNAGSGACWLQAMLLAVACGFAADAGATNGSGYFRGTKSFSDTPYEIMVADAYAYRDKDPTDAAKQVTVVVLADKAINAAAITGALDREAAIRDQMDTAKASYVAVTLKDGDDSPDLSIHVEGVPGNTAMSGGFKVTLQVNDGKRVEGRCSNDPKSRRKYPTDVDFAVAIATPDPGTALPAGGGAAGNAYVAYVAAVRKGDVDAIAQGMEKDHAQAFLTHRKDADFKQMLGMFQAMSPKEIRVLGGALVGTRATLEVQGKDSDGNELKGNVRLLKDADGWRVADEHLTTLLK